MTLTIFLVGSDGRAEYSTYGFAKRMSTSWRNVAKHLVRSVHSRPEGDGRPTSSPAEPGTALAGARKAC
jgi:hypothetical protein